MKPDEGIYVEWNWGQVVKDEKWVHIKVGHREEREEEGCL